MKNAIFLLIIMSSSACIAQSARERAKKMLPDMIGTFKASDEVNARVIDDGSTRISRNYASGDKTLEIKIGIQKGEEIEKTKDSMLEVIEEIKAMGESGRLETVAIDDEKTSGVLMFRSGKGSAIIIGYNKFFIDVSMRGATDMAEFQKTYQSLDFSVLKKSK